VKSDVLGWRPGLEGLRGVAVLAVMLYHFDATAGLFPGGSLGVDLFFVLSGFLITTLLLEERWRTGMISLAAFYRRRARRLLPALILFLAFFALITIAASQPGVDRLPATVGASLLYVFNWLDDWGGASTGGAGHLWSLSVEEQFYLAWPVALILALKARGSVLLWISLATFIASASLPAWSGRDYGSMYSGTDFRAQEIMAGAILAQLRFAGVLTPGVAKTPPFRLASGVSAAFFLFFLLSLESRVDFLYAGLYTATAVFGAIIVCAALYAPPRVLLHPVVSYLGTRSYALYLWHHAVDFWARDLGGLLALALSVGLSLAAAEASWRLVERPDNYLFTLVRRARDRFTNYPALPMLSPADSAIMSPKRGRHVLRYPSGDGGR
jgi:peptidoglycan/LPS O-acetylase OafA/YrhL